jgi:hypothetical protein
MVIEQRSNCSQNLKDHCQLNGTVGFHIIGYQAMAACQPGCFIAGYESDGKVAMFISQC